jgi:hypothetical protein
MSIAEQSGAQGMDAEALIGIQRQVHAQEAANDGHNEQPRGPQGKWQKSAAAMMREATNPDAMLNAALDRAFGDGGETKNTPAAKAATTGKATATGGAADATEGGTVEEKASAGDRSTLGVALKALRLDGYTDADFEGMSEERIADLGKRAAARQKDVNLKLEAASKSKNEQGTASEATKPTGKTGKGAQSAKDDDPDDTIVEEFVTHAKDLNELYGVEEFGRPLAKAMARILSKPMERIAALEAELEEVHIDKARANLRERFPQVEQEEHRSALRERMKVQSEAARISGTPYTSLQELMHDSAMVLWGRQAIEAAASSAQARPKARAAPAPSLHTRGNSGGKPKTLDSRLDDAIDAALDGGDEKAVSRAFNPRV